MACISTSAEREGDNVASTEARWEEGGADGV